MIAIKKISGGLAEGDREFDYEAPVKWYSYNRSTMWGYVEVSDGESSVELKVDRDGRLAGVSLKEMGEVVDWPEIGEGMLAEGLPVVMTGWDREIHDLQHRLVRRRITIARRETELGVFWGNTDYITCLAQAEKALFLISANELVGVIFCDMTEEEWMMFDELEMTGGR